MSNIMYIHGLGSTANQGNTIKWLRDNYGGEHSIYSFDIPLNPNDALELVRAKAKENKIDIVVATSLGGFYACLIDGVKKLLVNPCLKPSLEIPKLAPIGEVKEFFGPREDGIQSYMLTEPMVKEYLELEKILDALPGDRGDMDFIFGLNDENFSYLYKARTLVSENHIYTCQSGHRLSKEDKENILKPVFEALV